MNLRIMMFSYKLSAQWNETETLSEAL